MTDTLPSGVKLNDWDDVTTRRTSIFDSVLKSVGKQFPQSYGGVRLEVNDLHFDGPERFTLADQKRALLTNRYLHRKLKGMVRLVDEATGDPIEEKPMTLMKVPVLTDRGTFIHNGNEYTTMAQARLLSGVYTRRKATGELESHFNVQRGTGNSFRIHLEPDTGLFKMNIGQASLRLYPLLRDLGIPDEQLEKTWGSELLAKNRAKYDARVFDKAYARLVRRPDPNATREQKAAAILESLKASKLNRGVVQRTLPNRFNSKIAAAWKRGAAMTLPDPIPVGDDKDSFNKADYMMLAQFLNEHYKAGIPLDLPTSELVDVILAKLQEQMPDFKGELLNALQKSAARDYGCLMATLPAHQAVPIVKWCNDNFKPEDVAISGIEQMPHVTIRFGFKPGFDIERLKKLLKDQPPVSFTLKEITRFKGVEGGNADCIVVEVDSPDLVALRKKIDDTIKAGLEKPTYASYKPHLTLAYVKPGACKNLTGHAWFDGNTYVLRSLMFSTPGSKAKIEIPLNHETTFVPPTPRADGKRRVEGKRGSDGDPS